MKKFVIDNEEKIIFCDIFELISWKNSTKEEREELWDDNLHFKPKGYDLMGEEIFKSIFEKYLK